MDGTVHRSFAGVSLGSESFTDFDFADDVAVLSRPVWLGLKRSALPVSDGMHVTLCDQI